ncbi:caspase family protein [Clostridium estertheticum]|uniref:caspase family protein n=1 Tax=Clostridium estertheticum TaxID=238834 RepID=UPI001C0E43C1|nr:caspase family protein [Clostridium estertheticum]MBU3171136.1 caspase family protein [Clostridium estertheticum]
MKRYAIIISCEDYIEYPNICFCHADAILMEQTLGKYCDYDNKKIENIMLYPGSDFNNPNDILSRVKDQIGNSNEGDTILFYFAGHGVIYNDEAYLLLPDSQKEDFENTALSLKKLNQQLSENSRCNFRIFDACHSGFDTRGVEENSFNDSILDHGWITLASCAKDQKSYPDSVLEQGAFTYCLTEAIKEFKDNDLIFAEELKIKVCSKMQKWCEQNNKKQTPTLNAAVSGNISIAKRITNENDENIEILYEGEIILEKQILLQADAASVVQSNMSNTLWESPNGISLPKRADVATILNFNIQLKPKDIEQISDAYNSEYYEMTSEFIWKRALNLLRKKVLSLGVEFVSEMIGISNFSYINNLPPFETINLAFELGFIDATGKLRLKNNNELMDHYSLKETNDEMTEDQVKEIIRTCIQYVLGQDDSNLQLEYGNFREKLKLELIEKNPHQLEILLNSPYFYQKTTIRTLMNLLKETDGGEHANVSANMITIVPYIWDKLLSEEKYFIGTNYAQYSNESNNKCIVVLKNVLMKVKGFDYVPENLRSLTFIEAANKLMSAHYGNNNFYNEPKAVSELRSLGTIIPKPALEVVINSVLATKLGNSYGTSWSAQEYANEILDSLHLEQWRQYFNLLFVRSEVILQKISCSDERTERWFELAERYKLNELEIVNPHVKTLLNKSIEKNKALVSSIARNLCSAIN